MGLDKQRFINLSIDDNLTCPLCTMILEKPVYCLKCGRFICEACGDMFTCEGTEQVDPELRNRYKVVDDSFSEESDDDDDDGAHIYQEEEYYSQEQKDILEQLLNLRLKCVHPGCLKIDTLRNIQKHQNQCKNSETYKQSLYKQYCSDHRCEWDSQINQQIHMKDCPLFNRKCGQCGQNCYQKDFDSHSCIQYLLNLNKTIELKNTILKEENNLLDNNEIQMKQQFDKENEELIQKTKEYKKENLLLKKNTLRVQQEFQKEMSKLESSVIPRMRIFQENAQQRVISFENQQLETLNDFKKKVEQYLELFHRDIYGQIRGFQSILNEQKKNIIKGEESEKLQGLKSKDLKNNFMMKGVRKMKF